jgi:hypothetical protein
LIDETAVEELCPFTHEVISSILEQFYELNMDEMEMKNHENIDLPIPFPLIVDHNIYLGWKY